MPVIIGESGIVTKGLKENFLNRNGKTLSRFTTNDYCTGNITHNTESTAV